MNLKHNQFQPIADKALTKLHLYIFISQPLKISPLNYPNNNDLKFNSLKQPCACTCQNAPLQCLECMVKEWHLSFRSSGPRFWWRSQSPAWPAVGRWEVREDWLRNYELSICIDPAQCLARCSLARLLVDQICHGLPMSFSVLHLQHENTTKFVLYRFTLLIIN